MDFQGKGIPMTREGIESACQTLGVQQPEIWAVLHVETKGFGFFQDRRPQILFERHKFSKCTNRTYDAAYPDISNKLSGGYALGINEYARLEKAMGLDKDSALKSASWGIGQVMGFNYADVGFTTVGEMVDAMVKDEDSQLKAMADFIKKNSLDQALRAKNWRLFASRYNGTGYEKNNYHGKLEKAHAKLLATLPDLRLRWGQAALFYLNFDPGPIDGLQGANTRSALTRFQTARGLTPSAELDAATEARLREEAFPV